MKPHPDSAPSDETTVDLDASTAGDLPTADRTLQILDPEIPSTSLGEADVILLAHPDKSHLGRRFKLPTYGELTFGRSSRAHVSLPELQSVSRLHARLVHRGDRVLIEDARSTNGTYVNDHRIVQPTILASGDRFQVGAVHFKFLHEADPELAYHEAIYQMVIRDGLTQAFNKRKFDEELVREWARASRHQRPLALILFDVDHFKKVNDTHGHLCGDAVLQQIARRVSQHLRPEQLFARVGGEEFVVLSPETDGEGALVLAEKLREVLAGEAFHHGDLRLKVTCSFGVAIPTPPMATSEDLYEAADQALYRSKRGGRNRVSVHTVDGSQSPGV